MFFMPQRCSSYIPSVSTQHAVLLYAAAIVHSVVATDGDCMDNVSVSLLQMDVHVSSHSDVNKIGTRSQSMSYLVGSSLAEGRKHGGTRRGAAAFAHGVSYTLVQGLPEFEKPRIYLANGCAGTSWIKGFTGELLDAHGYKVIVDKVALNRSQYVNASELRKLQADAAAQGQTLVLKIGCMAGTWLKDGIEYLPAVIDALRDMESYFVGTYRQNAVDRLLCCAKWPEEMGVLGSDAGYLVDVNTGIPTEQLNDQSYRFAEEKKVDYKIYLDPEKLVDAVNAQIALENDTMKVFMQESLLPGLQYFTMEDLSDFEADASKLDSGVTIWSNFLKQWGVVADQEKTKAILKRVAGRYPLEPHAEEIYNFMEVKNVLESYPNLFEFLRL